MDSKRIFLAIPIEPVEPVVEKMRRLQQQLLTHSIKWVSTGNLHLTLFFFGQMPVQQIAELKKLLKPVAKDFHTFNLSLTGPGIFKKGNKPRVLWLGIQPSEQLFEIKLFATGPEYHPIGIFPLMS